MAVREKWERSRPLTLTTEEAVSRVLGLVQGVPAVLLLYLFGSRAADRAEAASDIDFAFLSDRDFSWDDYYMLHSAVVRTLGTDRVNFLWLNKADPVITFDVIATGRTLYYKDADTLNDFELKAKKTFYDYRHYLKKHRNGL